MPRVRRAARRQFVVAGLYAALLGQERRRIEQTPADPRWRYTAAGRRGEEPPPRWRTDRRELDSLEAVRPVLRQGRRLRGHSLPDVPLGCDRAFDWFEVSADDTVRAA